MFAANFVAESVVVESLQQNCRSLNSAIVESLSSKTEVLNTVAESAIVECFQ